MLPQPPPATPVRHHVHHAWRQRLCRVVLGLSVATAAPATLAIEALEEYSRRVDSARNITALGEDMFGDEINYFNGTTSFKVTDVSIPGNSRLPVAIGRTHAVGEQRPDGAGLFGEWDLDIPYMTGVYATGYAWQVEGPNPHNRCSGVSPTGWYRPPTVQNTDPSVPSWRPGWFEGREYWSGNSLHIPGQGDQPILQPDAGYTRRPQDGNTYRWTTTGNWFFSCLPTLASGQPGEGFVALSPDGTRYHFNWMSARKYAPLNRSERVGSQTLVFNLARQKVFLYPTRVEDRFGNWVNYEWTGDRLNRIVASDGRALSLTYVQAGTNDNASWKVQSVSDGTRTWQYRYTQYGYLDRVTLPDGTAWELTTNSAIVNYQVNYYASVSNCNPRPLPVNQTYSYVMRHPSGARATFDFKAIEHGRTYAPICQWDSESHMDANEAPSMYYHVMSLEKKRIEGAGALSREWLVSYSAPVGSRENCTSCPTPTKTVSVTDSSGKFSRYTFGTRYGRSEGKLQQIERGASPFSILSIESTAYDDDPAAPAAFVRFLGEPGHYRGAELKTGRVEPQKSTTISRDGATFLRETETFDSYARPLVVRKASSLGYTRREQTEYQDFTNLWVLGQLRRLYNINGSPILMSEIEYDALARPWKAYNYGKLENTLAYHADGNVASITDGRNNVTLLGNWKRGVPRSITFPDTPAGSNAGRSIGVDDIGRVTSVTDENGYTTAYGYDAMGRLASVVYPGNDSMNWAPEQFEFRPLVNGDVLPPGVVAGQWRHFSGKANYAKFTYYDTLWRPVLVQEYDTTNRAGTLRTTKTEYTADGQTSFQSYPSSTDQALATGVRTEYDALNRVTYLRADSELGVLTTRTEYLPGLKKRVTNPRQFQTTTEYAAWEAPGYDTPMVVLEPENKVTEIQRDIFGKITRLIRRSTDNTLRSERAYYYNANQLLCRVKDPESGSTMMNYDEAGNIAWTASGIAVNSTGCELFTAANSGRAVYREYDARNRLTRLNFHTGDIGDQDWTYTRDGLPSTVTTYNAASLGDTVVNTYTYNKRRLLTGESMSQPGRAIQSVGYQYDANGVMSNQTMPTGLSIHHALNGLGQSTRVYDQSGQNYATNVLYHPNGSIRSFVYGNGIAHTMTQNARQMPLRVTDGSDLQDNEYAYDGNGNVTNIVSHLQNDKFSMTRAMQYDAADRLTWAHSNAFGSLDGVHAFSYNALDDIASWKASGIKDYAQYVYDPNNRRLTSILNTAGATIVGLGYDAQGNLANRNGQVYEFDHGNRLRRVSGIESYRYDAHGRRVASIGINRESIHSFYNLAGQIIHQDNARPDARKTEDFVHLAGSLLAVRERSHATGTYAIRYQHTDALGTPVATSTESGKMAERRIHDPYGGALTLPSRQTVSYTGHVQDGATGLTYMQQRYYDASMGRFLSVDPVAVRAVGDNFNRYFYAANNPYRFVDPDGRDNQLGIKVKFAEGFARTDNPTAKDTKVLNAAQRSVDLTVSAVMNGSDEARKADLKSWEVSADPDYTNKESPKAFADTLSYPANEDQPKLIDTTYTKRIAEAADPGQSMTFSDGVTANSGDPALLAIGAHELGHGSDGNMAIQGKAQSEKDVGKRVLDTVKTSNDIDKGDIK
jgi:RHS repeat-associated protein